MVSFVPPQRNDQWKNSCLIVDWDKKFEWRKFFFLKLKGFFLVRDFFLFCRWYLFDPGERNVKIKYSNFFTCAPAVCVYIYSYFIYSLFICKEKNIGESSNRLMANQNKYCIRFREHRDRESKMQKYFPLFVQQNEKEIHWVHSLIHHSYTFEVYLLNFQLFLYPIISNISK